MDASPVKRRVLGALDPNASSSPKARSDTAKHGVASPVKPVAPPPSSRAVTAMVSPTRLTASSPSAAAAAAAATARTPGSESRKRLLSVAQATTTPIPEREEAEPSAKRPRLSQETQTAMEIRLPSSSPLPSASPSSRYRRQAPHRNLSPTSPATSSIFDNSAADIDVSQVTTLTELDAAAAAPTAPLAAPLAPLISSYHASIPPRPRLTREQARQKAEIIRSRLELANYKVRTGQTDVPLDLLEKRVGMGRQHANGAATGFAIPAAAPSSFSSPSSSFSYSYPGPLDNYQQQYHSGSTPGRTRRPLPGHPVRRASQDIPSSSFSLIPSSQREDIQDQQDAAAARRRWGGEVVSQKRPESAEAEDADDGFEGLPRLPSSWQGRGAAYTIDNTRIAQEALKQRRKSATSVVEVVEDDGDDGNATQDEEEDGGAAKGLLSLARG